MTDNIRLSIHAKERMYKRGYTKKDIISCILSGSILERQVYQGKLSVLIEGKDADGLPMALVIGHDQNPKHYVVVTVMPPIHDKFRSVI